MQILLVLTSSTADGIRSVVQPLVVGDAASDSARPSDFSAFHVTLDTPDIKAALGHISASSDADEPATLTSIISADPTQRTVVAYPCRDFQLVDFV